MPYKDPAKAKAYKESHRQEARDYAKIHYGENQEKAVAYAKDYRNKNRQKVNANAKIYRQILRSAVILAYGGKCVCCGETELHFLSIDHINGGGYKHKKQIGMDFYAWLKSNDYPYGFQVMCFNCNLAKGFYGVCPHQLKIRRIE